MPRFVFKSILIATHALWLSILVTPSQILAQTKSSLTRSDQTTGVDQKLVPSCLSVTSGLSVESEIHYEFPIIEAWQNHIKEALEVQSSADPTDPALQMAMNQLKTLAADLLSMPSRLYLGRAFEVSTSKEIRAQGYLYELEPALFLKLLKMEFDLFSRQSDVGLGHSETSLTRSISPIQEINNALYLLLEEYRVRRGLSPEILEKMWRSNIDLFTRSHFILLSKLNIMTETSTGAGLDKNNLLADARLLVSENSGEPLELEIKNEIKIPRVPGKIIIELGRLDMRKFTEKGRAQFMYEVAKYLRKRFPGQDITIYAEADRLGATLYTSEAYGFQEVTEYSDLKANNVYILKQSLSEFKARFESVLQGS